MENTNDTDQQKLKDDLFQDFVRKEYKNVTQSCQKLQDGPLQKIGIYEDTVLHMAAHSNQSHLVLELLKKLPADHQLSDIKNKDRNTVLHEVATSNAMKDAAKEMVGRDRGLLIARNELGEAPIFCAARHGQTEMFKFLAGEMELTNEGTEDYKPYLWIKDGTTVLHISVTTECFGLAHYIASTYPDLITEKDQESMTALRYIASNPSAFGMQQTKIRQELELMNPEGQVSRFIEAISGLTEELIHSDWSLKEAMNKSEERDLLDELVKILVAKDTSWDASIDAQNVVENTSELSQESSTTEYKKSVENPLLLATISNIPEIVRAIINCHPQALQQTNKEGMNILHLAILYHHIEIFDMVVEEFEVLSRRLLSARDDKGNSLLHMVGQKRKGQVSEKMQSPALQLRKELLLFEKVKKACKVHVTKPLNKENKTAEELFSTRNEQLHQEAKEWLMRTTENCTIVSVFIATVAFAAAYTVPGGPDQTTGIPILHSKTFFVVYIIADVISLALALTSVGIFLSILTSSFPLEDFKNRLFKKLIQGIICLIVSVSMMAVAFGATIILIMEHNWENIVWHVVAFLPVPIFLLSYSPLRSAVLGTGFRDLFKKVVKSVKVVALVALITLPVLLIYLSVVCKELMGTVRKACGNICKRVRSICGKKSNTQSYQRTAAPDTGV